MRICKRRQKQGRLTGLQLCDQAQQRAMAPWKGSLYVLTRCVWRAYLNVICLMKVQCRVEVVVRIQIVNVACSVLVPLVLPEISTWPCTARAHFCAEPHNRPKNRPKDVVSRLALGKIISLPLYDGHSVDKRSFRSLRSYTLKSGLSRPSHSGLQHGYFNV